MSVTFLSSSATTLVLDAERAAFDPADPLMQAYVQTRTTREAYLAWVAQWKATYAALECRIREVKADLRNPASRASHPDLMRTKRMQRLEARALLVLRAAGKLHARRQAAAARAARGPDSVPSAA